MAHTGSDRLSKGSVSERSAETAAIMVFAHHAQVLLVFGSNPVRSPSTHRHVSAEAV